MKASERVLGPHGKFEAFPERLERKAVEHGAKQAAANSGEPEDLIANGKKGKAELQKDIHEREKAQAKIEQIIKEHAAKKALNEQKYQDAKAKFLAENKGAKDPAAKEEKPLAPAKKNGKK
jgi:hypothetical protein